MSTHVEGCLGGLDELQIHWMGVVLISDQEDAFHDGLWGAMKVAEVIRKTKSRHQVPPIADDPITTGENVSDGNPRACIRCIRISKLFGFLLHLL